MAHRFDLIGQLWDFVFCLLVDCISNVGWLGNPPSVMKRALLGLFRLQFMNELPGGNQGFACWIQAFRSEGDYASSSL